LSNAHRDKNHIDWHDQYDHIHEDEAKLVPQLYFPRPNAKKEQEIIEKKHEALIYDLQIVQVLELHRHVVKQKLGHEQVSKDVYENVRYRKLVEKHCEKWDYEAFDAEQRGER